MNKFTKIIHILSIMFLLSGCDKKDDGNKNQFIGSQLIANTNLKADDFAEVDCNQIENCVAKYTANNNRDVIYKMSASGFGGSIVFVTGFSDGQYLGYVDVSNNETKEYGYNVISRMNSILSGRDVNYNISNDYQFSTIATGKTVTANAIKNALTICVQDYNTYYNK